MKPTTSWGYRLLLVVLLLAGSGGSAAWGAERVVLQLKWIYRFQFAGYLAASVKGFYRAEGLDVNIVEGAPGGSPAKAVLSGNANFGVGDADVLYARLQGKPLVMLGAIFQHSARVLLTREDSNIRIPSDLYHHKVMLSNYEGAAELRALLVKEGVPLGSIQFITPWSLEALERGEVDAVSAYSIDQSYVMLQHGVKPHMIKPADYGIDFYGDGFFTSEREVQTHPDRVAKFRRATLRGWDYAMTHVEEIIDSMLVMDNTWHHGLTREALRAEAVAMQPLILSGIIEIGHMNPARWERIAETYVELGLAKPGYNLDGFLFDPEPVRLARQRKELIAFFIGVVLLAGASILWIIQLRSAVKHRTAELSTEIEQRKRTEEHLREKEEKFRLLADNSTDMISRHAPDGSVLYVSPSCFALLGYTQEEIVGRKSVEFLRAELFEETCRAFRPGTESPDTQVLSVQLRRKDGTYTSVEVSSRLVRDPLTGTIREIHASSRDISKRKEAENRFKNAFEHAAVGMTLVGIDGRLLKVNDAMCAMLGYSAQELEERTTFDITHPEDRKSSEDYFRGLMEEANVRSRHEKRYIHKDGHAVWVIIASSLLRDERGTPIHYISQVQDISERKRMEEALSQSEAQFKAIVQQSSDAIYVLQGEQIELVNPAWELMFGYKAQDVTGNKFTYQAVVAPESQDLVRQRQRMREHGEPIPSRYEMMGRRHDGTIIELEVSVANIIWRDRPAVLGIYRDISERKATEKAILSSLAEKEVLLKEVHHRVKNNMQVISSILSLQSQYVHDSRDLDLFRESQARVRSMALVHEKLYQSPSLSRIDIGEYLRDLAGHIIRSFDNPRVKFDVNCSNVILGVDTAIPCGLIVNELLNNAFKYAFPDGRPGIVRVSMVRTGTNGILLRVTDDGIGLPETIQVESTSTLGLQLVTALVGQLDGVLDVDRNNGTSFSISFKQTKSDELVKVGSPA